MFGKNPDLYKLEEIIVCIKMFTGYYPTAYPIFILEMISSGKWENLQLIPLLQNISRLKDILRLFPAKKNEQVAFMVVSQRRIPLQIMHNGLKCKQFQRQG